MAEEVNRIDPDCEVFIPTNGKGILLPNGNMVALYATEKYDDWMFQFRNEKTDRHTLLRLSPSALYAMASLIRERIVNGTLKNPVYPDEIERKKTEKESMP
jgi:hypothetical protein